jgi:hypothetical protein
LFNWFPTRRKKRGRLRINRMEGIRYVRTEKGLEGRKWMDKEKL